MVRGAHQDQSTIREWLTVSRECCESFFHCTWLSAIELVTCIISIVLSFNFVSYPEYHPVLKHQDAAALYTC